MQKNIVKYITLLSALCLAQKPGILLAQKLHGRKMPRERILCALSYYPVAMCPKSNPMKLNYDVAIVPATGRLSGSPISGEA